MTWAKRGICAGSMVWLLAAGCVLPDYLGLSAVQSTGPGGDRLVAGSLETVSQSTQGSLQKLGFNVVATPEAEAVRLSCSTRANNRFDVVLTRVRSQQGEQTRVRIEWKGAVDEKIGLQIFEQLEVQNRPAGPR